MKIIRSIMIGLLIIPVLAWWVHIPVFMFSKSTEFAQLAFLITVFVLPLALIGYFLIDWRDRVHNKKYDLERSSPKLARLIHKLIIANLLSLLFVVACNFIIVRYAW